LRVLAPSRACRSTLHGVERAAAHRGGYRADGAAQAVLANRPNADPEPRHCAAFGTPLPSLQADRTRDCSHKVQRIGAALRAFSLLGVGIALTCLAMSPVGFSLEVG
jgi:hypothetical protein